MGSAATAYALSYSICQLVHGPLGDRAGAYRVVAWAACLSALATAACALATSFTGLVLLRLGAGAVAGAIGPLTLAWVSTSCSPEERPVALARMSAAAILGTAAGQAGGGVIGGLFGWPAVFVALSALFAGSGVALMLIARQRPQVLFAGLQRDLSSAASPLLLVRRRGVVRVLAIVGVQGFAIALSLTYVGALLHERLRIGPAHAGLIVSFYGLGGIAFVLLAPRLIGLCRASVRAGIGGATLGGSFVALALAHAQWSAVAALLAIGFGFLMLHNVLQVMAAHMAPDALSTSLSLFAAASCLSQAIGAAAGGYLYDRAGSAAVCLLSAALLTTLGVAVAIVIRREPPTAPGA